MSLNCSNIDCDYKKYFDELKENIKSLEKVIIELNNYFIKQTEEKEKNNKIDELMKTLNSLNIEK
jgi:hypothetical protein